MHDTCNCIRQNGRAASCTAMPCIMQHEALDRHADAPCCTAVLAVARVRHLAWRQQRSKGLPQGPDEDKCRSTLAALDGHGRHGHALPGATCPSDAPLQK